MNYLPSKVISIGLILLLFACNKYEVPQIDYSTPLFTSLHPTETGIDFQNIVEENIQNNVLSNNYIYSGGGTALGDINNDGLVDIFFVSNTVGKHALYLNQGDFKFKNVINESNIKSPSGWCSGVVMEDVNADGYLDIYLCKGGEHENDPELRTNELYINNKNGTFTESAKAYGLDDKNKGTQSAFFDYDNDGDLDVIVVNIPDRKRNLEERISIPDLAKYRADAKLYPRYKTSSDRLYRNEGNNTFRDVTEEMGLLNFGFGLGISIFDINSDGWQDIYITNDFDMDNFLYINRGGKFIESAKSFLKHSSYFAMGVDIADINNDGLLDVFEVEMLPESRKRAVVNMESMDRNKFEQLVSEKFVPQYMRNSLQINRGQGKFSEVAQYSGVAKTDWSWGTILVDLDDDGLKDIFVTNGIAKDMKDRDQTMVGKEIADEAGGTLTVDQHAEIFKSTKIQNYAYKNLGDLKFKNVASKWGFDYKGFSNALCYADLDNDGDLDLVINNINDKPLIYKNSSAQRGNNFINFTFKGGQKNLNALGAKVTLYTGDGIQYQEHQNVRGYQSSCQHLMHFGLGELNEVDSVLVVFPTGRQKLIAGPIKANQTMELNHQIASERYKLTYKGKNRYLTGASKQYGFDYRHIEIPFDDFSREILLPHKLSQSGPGIAIGDINGDQLDDFYIGAAHQGVGAIYMSSTNGTLTKSIQNFMVKDKNYEDIGACFFDADGDGDLDLYVVSGSNEFEEGSELFQDRLYLNDGTGSFKDGSNRIPKIRSSGSCVQAGDLDGDGDMDLFVGGKSIPAKYPSPAKSFILKNENGKFVDATNELYKDLSNIGMVSSATWTDFDKDKDLDLIIVGEWMGITVLENSNGKFTDVSSNLGLDNTEGWWYKIHPLDIDNDGDQDFICGNIGLNHKFKASAEKPFQVFCGDFDETGTNDIVLAFEQDDKLYPVRGRDCSSEQMPFILDKFPTFSEFGEAQVHDILGDKMKTALHKEVKLFASVILVNENNKFKIKHLPYEAQFSANTGIQNYDLNLDGYQDLILAGNMYQTEAETSRADAGYGLVLLNDKKGNFESLSMEDSGLYAPGDIKDFKIVHLGKENPIFVFANNNGPIQAYKLYENRLIQ